MKQTNPGNEKGETTPDPPKTDQLLGKEAEHYLREGGNIEDLPEPEGEDDVDAAIDESRDHSEDEGKNQPLSQE